MNNKLLIYKSSAGSGKTYTLVLEFLKLVLLNPSQYRSVLAVTFTNKATEEMKSRIVESLIEISDNKNSNLQHVIAKDTGLPVQVLPERASRVLDKIMHDYSGFSVSTIDSFFSKLLRSLAYELNLNLRFDIELNTDGVIREITDRMMDDTGTDPWLRNWLEEFILERIDDNKSWKVVGEIHKMAKELFTESYRDLFPDQHHKPDLEFKTALRKIVSDFETTMKAFGNEALDKITAAGLTDDDFNYKGSGTKSYFSKITETKKPLEFLMGQRMSEATDDDSKWHSRNTLNRDQVILLAQQTLVPIAQKIRSHIEKNMAGYASAKRVLQTLYLSGIYSLLDEKLKTYRDENNLVLISDTNRMLMQAVQGNDSSFIYEKSGNRYLHYMLDEFQDTSDYQWKNLLPLINNSLGSGQYAMLVGDAKQSIYRWRGGNMELLLTGVQQQLIHYSNLIQHKNLSDNYRSREQIVDFNNSFFDAAPDVLALTGNNELMKSAYHGNDLKQNWKKGNTGEGYVQLRFVPKGSETGSEEDPDKSWKQKACKVNIEIINKVLAAGYSYGDIVFLTRKNADAKLITSCLLENGFDRIISPESMQLHHSVKIQFLINLLSFIEDSENKVVLAHLVYYHNKIHNNKEGLTIHQLLTESWNTKMSLLPEEFRNNLHSYRAISLYEAVEKLIILFRFGNPPDAYLQRFLDVILEYSEKNPANITDFLAWWDENKDTDSCSVVIPSGEDAIRVMTIHKSKGLQFPVVIIPFADWKLKPDEKTILWVQSEKEPFNRYTAHPVKFSDDLKYSYFLNEYNSELQKNYCDNLNLLYVAFTRAEEQLYVVAPGPAKSSKKKSEAPSCVQDLIISTIVSSIPLNSFYDADSGIFEKGSFSAPYENKKERNATAVLTEWHAVPWQSRLQMVINKNKISLRDPEPPETKYGNLFHNMVSGIFNVVDAESFVTGHNLYSSLTADIQQRLITDIGIFIEKATAHNWFPEGAEILNEAELLLPDGSILRPDRLVIHDNKAIVIDYKTGAEEKHHSKQVQLYAEVLQQMGISETKLFLVYLSENKVVEIAA